MSARRARSTLDKARELQRALYRAAKASPTRRFHALYDKVSREDVLGERGGGESERWGSRRGWADHQSRLSSSGVEGFLASLATELRRGRYRPQPVRRVYGYRRQTEASAVLGIPAVRDRVVQAAAKVVLEPIFEADFRDSSYGFRPKRNAHQAMEQTAPGREPRRRTGSWTTDIEAFFDRNRATTCS